MTTMADLRPRIYLAARYSRREELLGYARVLAGMGCVVTSRWLQGNHQIDDTTLCTEANADTAARFATEDHNDLLAAEFVISFTETPRSGASSRGGRHVEFGMGFTAGLHLIVVGPRENVFHYLPGVRQYETWDAFLAVEFPNQGGVA